MSAKSGETLHIVSSMVAGQELSRALRAAGRKDRVIAWDDCLAYGPIDPPAPGARWRWMSDTLGYARREWDWRPTCAAAFWRRVDGPAARRIVWTSSRSAAQHAAFLAVVERLGDRPFEVLDVADIEITHRGMTGRRWRDKALSLSMMNADEIAAETLWQHARPLSATECAAHLEIWRRLRAENAALRVIGPEGLTSAPITHFDDALLSHTTDQWQRLVRPIGWVMAEGDGLYFQVGDDFLASRVAHLIATGALEYRPPAKDDQDWGYTLARGRMSAFGEVRLAGR